MTRRSIPIRAPRRLTLPLLLVASLGLGGCAGQAVQQSSTSPARAYTDLGLAYLERNNLPRAMAALDHALEADPRDGEALQAMAIVYQRQGETRLADEFFQRALGHDPGFTRARNNYAAFLYDQGHTREACAQLEQASSDTQYNNRAQLFANLGQCQREIGEVAAARQSLERAQAIDARAPRSYYLLAELEYAQGNYARAWEQLQVFMRLAGATPDSQRLASQISAAQGGNTSSSTLPLRPHGTL
ncbi:type IV pilus biogenesis/stability protein PilW [Halomonas sp. 328]|uniref:type IV pilus biogenesis/stability protein PilW n=1 Tax=Halomonas sp. 328 TaxID=2776704 RepID=UPI0018A79E7E|nr:type IV pilus biogenesis/stability protein PilW [Halomonas sp. 328]MBF8222739.1 type IV pilus biogenesis/stability protein PilW [Halomonas sp. 328]